jgi:hypothetical protein
MYYVNTVLHTHMRNIDILICRYIKSYFVVYIITLFNFVSKLFLWKEPLSLGRKSALLKYKPFPSPPHK